MHDFAVFCDVYHNLQPADLRKWTRTLHLFVAPLFKSGPGVSSVYLRCSGGGEFVLLMTRARHSQLGLCPELLGLSDSNMYSIYWLRGADPILKSWQFLRYRQELPHILRFPKPRLLFFFARACHLPLLWADESSRFPTILFHFFMIHFNMTVPSTSRSSKLSFFLQVFRHCACISLLCNACNMSCLLHFVF